jgi:hypothetical protein
MDPPDRQERRIRFGCGVLFGSVLAVVSAFTSHLVPWPWSLAVAVLFVFGCGYAALRLGDEFWWSESGRRWWP